MKLAKITGKDVRNALEFLRSNNIGCWHMPVLVRDDGWEYDIVIGWHDVGSEATYPYFDQGYAISWKIGYQSPRNAMQSDMDLDFDMPWSKKTGDVWGDANEMPFCETDEQFKDVADEINRVAKTIVEGCEADPDYRIGDEHDA